MTLATALFTHARRTLGSDMTCTLASAENYAGCFGSFSMTAVAVSAVAIATAAIFSLTAGALARFSASTTAGATVTLFPTGCAAAVTMAITIGVKRRGDRPRLMGVIVEKCMIVVFVCLRTRAGLDQEDERLDNIID